MAPSIAYGASLFEFVVGKGNGVKGLVDSGLSRVPDQYVQPPQERINKLVAKSHVPPPIDLSELGGCNHDQVAEAIIDASENLGFFQVVNHGVPVELLEQLNDTAHRFFNQPREKKAVYLKGATPTPLVTYGTSFTPETEKALEWKDYLSMVYTSDDEALQHWPNECKEVALKYLQKSSDMVRKILEVLLGKIGLTLDDATVDSLIGRRTVNMNFYPTCPNPDLTVGVGRHSDLGTLTVLLQDGIGGLYVKLEHQGNAEKEGEWIEIPPISGALVINIGDTLQILSNGRYKSAEHRVRTTSVQSRVSVPFFTMPRLTTKIRPVAQVVEKDGVAHYKEVLFMDYLNYYFGNAHDGKNSLDFAKMTNP